MDGIQAAFSLILKAFLLSAQWAGTVHIRQMRNLVGEKNNLEIEIQFLRERIFQLETELEIFRKHGKDTNRKPRYTLNQLIPAWHPNHVRSVDLTIDYWRIPVFDTIYYI